MPREPLTDSTSPDSPLSRALSRLRQGQDLRKGKIRKLRAALRTSQYENDLKLSIAAERLLKEWGVGEE